MNRKTTRRSYRLRNWGEYNAALIGRGSLTLWVSEGTLAETAMFRIKTIFGDRVRACSFEGQGAELLIRCRALNCMTHLGMPDSYAV